ncbi:MAG TPA: HAD-IA family hydrolase [Victivallales bacterium]|nr:HAD-IA family hydrolase [Victivallales bacterium]
MNLYIFDFDGTIADSYPVVVDIIKKYYKSLGIKDISSFEEERIRNMSSKQIIKNLSIPYYKIPSFVSKIRKMLKSEIERINMISGVSDMLFELNKENKLIVLTSNSEGNVKYFCRKFNIDFFDQINTERSLFGKADIIRKIIKNDNAQYNGIYYIGDETRDIDAAKKAGIKSVAVSWGYSHRDILEKHNPDFIINSPKELLDII